MSDTTDSKTAFPPSNIDEKAAHIQREVLTQDEPPNTIAAKQKEDALRRKLDRYVAPVMMMLMLISHLDRGNIGFAATQGMTTDIKLQGSQLNVRQPLCLISSISRADRFRLQYQYSTSSTSSRNSPPRCSSSVCSSTASYPLLHSAGAWFACAPVLCGILRGW